jgi:hypothetical protein
VAGVNPDGTFDWSEGNIGGDSRSFELSDILMTYGRTFDLLGWTIEPRIDDARFTHQRTKRGMYVSVEKVAPF